MSDANESPALAETVQEVQGAFPSDASLQDALSQLTLAGYDRADFSLPQDRDDGRADTANESAENPIDQTDKSQLRTMGTSMAGYAGAVAVAGATLATGGAAGVAIAAAAAVGAGTGLAAHAAGQAADNANIANRDERGREGRLILAVRARSAEKAQEIIGIMHQAGAHEVTSIERSTEMLTAGVSSASWTGA